MEMRDMANSYEPDSPPHIILKAEPESSESGLNFGFQPDSNYGTFPGPSRIMDDIKFEVTQSALDAVSRKREGSLPAEESHEAVPVRTRTHSYPEQPPGSYLASPVPYSYQPGSGYNYDGLNSVVENDRNRLGSVQSFTSDTTEGSDVSRNNNSIDEGQPRNTMTRVRRGSRKPYHRTTFTDYQIQQLSVKFNEKKYLSMQERAEIADRLSISQNQVKIWFQNKRAKEKRKKNSGQNTPIKEEQSTTPTKKPINATSTPTQIAQMSLPSASATFLQSGYRVNLQPNCPGTPHTQGETYYSANQVLYSTNYAQYQYPYNPMGAPGNYVPPQAEVHYPYGQPGSPVPTKNEYLEQTPPAAQYTINPLGKVEHSPPTYDSETTTATSAMNIVELTSEDQPATLAETEEQDAEQASPLLQPQVIEFNAQI